MLPLALLLACDAPPAAELVYISFAEMEAVEVDTTCPEDCIPAVTLQLTFEEHLLVDPSATVALERYRVEYTLDQAAPGPYESATWLEVQNDATGFVNVLPAGPRQQADVVAEIGVARAVGTARLTAFGLDWRDEAFEVWGEFPIAFQDLPDDLPGDE